MNRAVVAHAAFCAACALLALQVWTSRDVPRRDAPPLIAAEPDELESFTLRWPDGETHGVREGEGKGRGYALTVTYRFDPAVDRAREEAAKAAANLPPRQRIARIEELARAAQALARPDAQHTERKTFPPNLFVVAAIQKLTPFFARRALGEVPADKLAGMGLVPPVRRLEVRTAGDALALDVGNETFGGQAYYARVAGDSEILLIDADLVRSLEGRPAQLMDSRALTVAQADVVGMELEIAGRRAEFVQHHRDQFRQRYFSLPATPDAAVEPAAALLTTLTTTRTLAFVEVAPQGEPLALVRFLRDGAPPLEVRVFARAGGYTVTAGRWIGEIGETEGRKILEQARAAMPAA